jgi:hypothetical protein
MRWRTASFGAHSHIINLGGVPRGCDLFSIILREDGTETSMPVAQEVSI